MNKQLSALTQKEVTRKEFLTAVGFGVMSIMGIGSIVKLLTGKHGLTSGRSSSAGYGSSAYGGSKD